MSSNHNNNSPDHYENNVRIPIVSFLTSIVTKITTKTAWINLLVMLVIMINVVLRYGFHNSPAYVDEVIWHLYAFFMFGLAHAITTDAHIRVDIVHMNLTKKKQRVIEILGIIFLIMPFTIIIFDHSTGWTYHSFVVNEFSENTTGLPYRWVVKSLVPISMILIFIASLSELIKNIILLFHDEKLIDNRQSGNRSTIGRLFTPTITNLKED
jgi:TRAP-type mannitol/chloroaromatic compound transport system permease small subunit